MVTPRITSLLIKPASAVCNLDCAYCFYLDREADPYKALPARRMTLETLERLVDTYLFYSYPNSVFAFQGGEPTLAGLPFFEKLVEFQKHYGRNGQSVSNALQTNAILLDENWCDLFREYQWLLGVSLDGPEDIHDRYPLQQGEARHLEARHAERRAAAEEQSGVQHSVRAEPGQRGQAARTLQILSARWASTICSSFRWPSSTPAGNPLPFTITPEQYGRFLLRDVRPLVARAPQGAHPLFRQHRRSAGRPEARQPAPCTKPATATWWWSTTATSTRAISLWKSGWKLGNVNARFLARNRAPQRRRYSFASKKTLAHPECQVCEYQIDLPRRLPQVPPRSARQLRRSGLFLRGLQDDLFAERKPAPPGTA